VRDWIETTEPGAPDYNRFSAAIKATTAAADH
jgi:hypothetical protein